MLSGMPTVRYIGRTMLFQQGVRVEAAGSGRRRGVLEGRRSPRRRWPGTRGHGEEDVSRSEHLQLPRQTIPGDLFNG